VVGNRTPVFIHTRPEPFGRDLAQISSATCLVCPSSLISRRLVTASAGLFYSRQTHVLCPYPPAHPGLCPPPPNHGCFDYPFSALYPPSSLHWLFKPRFPRCSPWVLLTFPKPSLRRTDSSTLFLCPVLIPDNGSQCSPPTELSLSRRFFNGLTSHYGARMVRTLLLFPSFPLSQECCGPPASWKGFSNPPKRFFFTSPYFFRKVSSHLHEGVFS